MTLRRSCLWSHRALAGHLVINHNREGDSYCQGAPALELNTTILLLSLWCSLRFLLVACHLLEIESPGRNCLGSHLLDLPSYIISISRAVLGQWLSSQRHSFCRILWFSSHVLSVFQNLLKSFAQVPLYFFVLMWKPLLLIWICLRKENISHVWTNSELGGPFILKWSGVCASHQASSEPPASPLSPWTKPVAPLVSSTAILQWHSANCLTARLYSHFSSTPWLIPIRIPQKTLETRKAKFFLFLLCHILLLFIQIIDIGEWNCQPTVCLVLVHVL